MISEAARSAWQILAPARSTRRRIGGDVPEARARQVARPFRAATLSSVPGYSDRRIRASAANDLASHDRGHPLIRDQGAEPGYRVQRGFMMTVGCLICRARI